jgi:ornithine cyclodeaminase
MARSITAAQIHEICDLDSAIASQEKVFQNFAKGSAVLGPRAVLSQGDNAQFAYLARASELGPTIIKFGSVFPGNSGSPYPVVQTSILALSPKTGAVEYSFDGEAVTKLRTVAASLVAIQALRKSEIQKISIVGVGHQGIAHAEALRIKYPKARIIGITNKSKLNQFDEVGRDIAATEGSDLIILSTNSTTPVFEKLIDKSTVVSIGSFAPNRSEVGPDLIKSADRVVVDDVETARKQCGAIVLAEQFAPIDIKGLGETLIKASPEVSPEERNIYFSVGLGIQDAALVELILERL